MRWRERHYEGPRKWISSALMSVRVSQHSTASEASPHLYGGENLNDSSAEAFFFLMHDKKKEPITMGVRIDRKRSQPSSLGGWELIQNYASRVLLWRNFFQCMTKKKKPSLWWWWVYVMLSGCISIVWSMRAFITEAASFVHCNIFFAFFFLLENVMIFCFKCIFIRKNWRLSRILTMVMHGGELFLSELFFEKNQKCFEEKNS